MEAISKYQNRLETAEQYNREIQKHADSMVECAIEIGLILIEVKAECEHGEFMKALSEYTTIQQRQANRYMQAARHADKLMPNEQIQIGRPDHFTSLTNFLQFASEVELEQQVVKDLDEALEAGDKSIEEIAASQTVAMKQADVAELEERRREDREFIERFGPQLEQFAQSQAKWAEQKEIWKEERKEREADPEWQKLHRKAKWNFEELKRQGYAVDPNFRFLTTTPYHINFSVFADTALGNSVDEAVADKFTAEQLADALAGQLMIGDVDEEGPKKWHAVWERDIELARAKWFEICHWNEMMGEAIAILKERGFEPEEPMPVKLVAAKEGKKSA